jgi:hypothetical protein
VFYFSVQLLLEMVFVLLKIMSFAGNVCEMHNACM